MICPKCGNANRPGARFCKQCGAVLEQVAPEPPPRAAPPPSLPPLAETAPSPPLPSSPPVRRAAPPPIAPTAPSPPLPSRPVPPPPQPYPQPYYGPRAAQSGGAGQTIGKLALFLGYGLAIIGALAALAAFVLPWFSTGETGLDTVYKAFEVGGDQMFLVWGLVPLGALGLLLLSLLGLMLGLFGNKLSAGLARATVFLPLIIALSGVCGCFPLTSPLVSSLMASNFDLNNLSGAMAGLSYGFWLALGGIGVSLVGILLVLIGVLMARRRAAF